MHVSCHYEHSIWEIRVRIQRNKMFDVLRGRYRNAHQPLPSSEDVPGRDPSVVDTLALKECVERLRTLDAAMAELLTELERKSFEWCFLGGVPAKDAAKAFGVPPYVVYNARARGPKAPSVATSDVAERFR